MVRTTLALALSGFAAVASPLPIAAADCEQQWNEDVADFAVLNGKVSSLAVFDDGSGPALYAGGEFTHAGELQVNHIAKWDGEQWLAVGGGVTGETGLGFVSVRAMQVFDDGSGPALYIGGPFSEAGGEPIRSVAAWNGNSWVGQGNSLDFEILEDLEVINFGDGPQLIALTGTDTGEAVSVLTETDWERIGFINGVAYDLHAHTDFAGTRLYVAGLLQSIDGIPMEGGIAAWDGSSWQRIGESLNGIVYTLESMVSSDGVNRLFAGGRNILSNAKAQSSLAAWDGVTWIPLEAPGVSVFSGFGIRELRAFDDGNGQELYIGGDFIVVNDDSFYRNLTKWNGQEFLTLGIGGASGPLYSMLALDQHRLIIGGRFERVNVVEPAFDGNGIESPNLAIWQGCTPQSCPGDVTGDGFVDLDDLDLVLMNFGQQTDSGDASGDGVVDLTDLSQVLSNFGADC